MICFLKRHCTNEANTHGACRCDQQQPNHPTYPTPPLFMRNLSFSWKKAKRLAVLKPNGHSFTDFQCKKHCLKANSCIKCCASLFILKNSYLAHFCLERKRQSTGTSVCHGWQPFDKFKASSVSKWLPEEVFVCVVTVFNWWFLCFDIDSTRPEPSKARR